MFSSRKVLHLDKHSSIFVEQRGKVMGNRERRVGKEEKMGRCHLSLLHSSACLDVFSQSTLLVEQDWVLYIDVLQQLMWESHQLTVGKD